MKPRSDTTLAFYVPGNPIPQGSKRQSKNGHMYEANPNLGNWRQAIVICARGAMAGRKGGWPMTGPVVVFAEFSFARPKSHYGTGKNAGELRPGAPRYKTSAPDLDKLMRALGDSLTNAGAILDDSLIVKEDIEKIYSASPGVRVVVVEAEVSVTEGKK